MEVKEKRCKECEEEKDISEFSVRKYKSTLASGELKERDQVSTKCKACEKSAANMRSKSRYAKSKKEEYKLDGFSCTAQSWLLRCW